MTLEPREALEAQAGTRRDPLCPSDPWNCISSSPQGWGQEWGGRQLPGVPQPCFLPGPGPGFFLSPWRLSLTWGVWPTPPSPEAVPSDSRQCVYPAPS